MRASEIPHELEKIGHLYLWIEKNSKPLYSEYDIFKTFERVYKEHFTVVHEKVEVKSNNQLSSDYVQSPDDLDATCLKKNNKHIKGQSINIVETAHPDNQLNLITDVSTYPLNKDDSKVLNERINKCLAIRMNRHTVFYFTHRYYLQSRRQKIIDSHPR